MRFRTVVKVQKNDLSINHENHLLLMGSCFVEHIGRKLDEAKFNVLTNPYGVLYNPISLVTSLMEIYENKTYTTTDLFKYQGMWHSVMHHSLFSGESKDKVLENINKKINDAHSLLLNKTNYLIITFGSAWVYHLKQNHKIVGNCHKLPERNFNRYLMGINDIVSKWTQLLELLFKLKPTIKVLFTVSPIRHIRDGLHENQLSKATLLLSINELKKRWKNQVYYFPAYEIVLDELRDYRFFAEDMCHPSPLTIDYIWEKFIYSTITVESQRIINECDKINKALRHRPFNPNSDEHQFFLKNILKKIDQMSKRYPKLVFEKEVELCRTQLI